MPSTGLLWQAGKLFFYDKSAAPTPMARDSPSPPALPAPDEFPVNRFGLSEVYAPAGPCDVDLVFIHGLNGDPRRTWTSKNTGVYWPRDLLPSFVKEQRARVLVYGYDADVTALGAPGVSKDKIHNHAERLIADLFANRRIRKATERPIIFVAHSLGGLVVKRALISSSEISGPKTVHLRSIFVSTYGILFLGTPHKGSNVARWGTYLSSLCQAVVPARFASTESQLIEALQTNSETLLNIDRQFSSIMDDFHIFFFHEAKPMNLKGTLHFIVDEDSAAPPLPDVERAGIQADHSHMCKFDSESAPGFDLVVDGVQRYSEQAPSVIRERWIMEKHERASRDFRKARENYPGALDGVDSPDPLPKSAASSPQASLHSSIIRTDSSTHPKNSSPPSRSSSSALDQPNKPTEPYFIVPPGFRANAFFVGMEKEMHELDIRIFDSRRRNGTACVLLHGQPGAGKTQVARQYVFKNRYKFPGGVFWIDALLIDEVYRVFWQIHQRVVAKGSTKHTQDSSDKLDRNFIDEVRDWFSERGKWLIVFDGVSVEHDRDVEELQKFIPDSANSAIIYVSRSRRLETMQGLLRPAAIKIGGLKDADASQLLFKELGIKNPRPAQVRSAKTLAKKVGGLPMAIDAIARRLADTHEPIEKFNIKSYSDDPKLGGTYHRVMSDLQKNEHTEAISLMNLLCFFGPHIPVEMVRLGLRPLAKEGIVLTASEEGVHADLNVTFGILMRHALIERNEPNDSDSISSGRDSCIEPEPIDVLNIHAVIQNYWRDSLKTSTQLPLWLSRAAKLLVSSFQEADLRIRRSAKPGRPSDYRWYMVHARRLRTQTLDYATKHNSLQGIRAELDAVIEQLQVNIQVLEPSSSQESLSQGEFQISIFDRTSNSSSTDPSQTGAPLSRLNTDDFDSAVTDESPMETDGSNYVMAPVQLPSGAQFPILYSYPMQRDLSGSTIRAGSSNGYDVAAVSKAERPILSPTRSDSFRSASAGPLIDHDHANGLLYAVSALSRRGPMPVSWNALSYLTTLSRKNTIQRNEGSVTPDSGSEISSDAKHAATTAPVYEEPKASSAGLTAAPIQQQAASSNTARESPLQRPSPANPSSTLYEQRTALQSALENQTINNPRSRASSRTVTRISPQIGGSASAPGSGEATPRISFQESPGRAALAMPSIHSRTNILSPIPIAGGPQQATHPPLVRIRSVSPLPRQEPQRSTSPFAPRPLIQATPEFIPGYSEAIPDAVGFEGYNQPLQSFPQQAIPYGMIGTRAPNSDPLPRIATPQDQRPKSSSRHPSGMRGLRGLGIFSGNDENATAGSGLGTPGRRRKLPERSKLRANRAHSVQPARRELAQLDSNASLHPQPPAHAFGPLQDLSTFDDDDAAELVGIPSVSFAPAIHPAGAHRHTGTALDGYNQGWIQQQQQQAQAFINPFAFAPAPPALVNTAQGPMLVPQLNAAGFGGMPELLADSRGAPSRSSAPYLDAARLGAPGWDGQAGAEAGSKRRRTLSAPESPGVSQGGERMIWET